MLEILSSSAASSIFLASTSLFGHGHWLCEYSYSYDDLIREAFQFEVLYDRDLSFQSRGTISYFDDESSSPFALYSTEGSGVAIVNGNNFYTIGKTTLVKEEFDIDDRMPEDYVEKILEFLNQELPKENRWLTVTESSPSKMTIIHQHTGTVTKCGAITE